FELQLVFPFCSQIYRVPHPSHVLGGGVGILTSIQVHQSQNPRPVSQNPRDKDGAPGSYLVYFLSTSTYSASITPSSFLLASPLLPGSVPLALPLGPAPPPGGGVCACADLYICSASLCEA